MKMNMTVDEEKEWDEQIIGLTAEFSEPSSLAFAREYIPDIQRNIMEARDRDELTIDIGHYQFAIAEIISLQEQLLYLQFHGDSII